MMKIEKIDKSHLKNSEHLMFHTEFRNLVIKEGAANLKVEPMFNAYSPLYDNERDGIMNIVESAYTRKIKMADKARDETYSGMVLICKACAKHHSNAVREAAKKLKVLFDTYGNLSRKPLNEQTSDICNILQELRGDFREAAGIANMIDWADELEARNNAFDALVKKRYDETAAKTNVVVKAARAELDAAYDAIVGHINAYAAIEGGEAHERFIRALNVVIAKYRAIVNVRLGRV